MFSSRKNDRLVSIDIGTSAIKAMELNMQGDQPKLVAAAIGATPAESIKNNAIIKAEKIGEALRSLLNANDITASRAVIGIPGPTAFTKRIASNAGTLKELEENIAFEASSYIPHKIQSVYFDYQVLGRGERSGFNLVLVAVKNEIVSSYLEAVSHAGLEPVIADVDYFALENMFEINYPEELAKTAVLVDIGARYSSVNILQNGESLFVGDVGVGGRLYTDALCEALKIDPLAAEQAKSGNLPAGVDQAMVVDTVDRTTEHIASELHRQIGFYWNAANTDKPLEAVFLSGGGGEISGLADEISAKVGLPTHRIDPFRRIDCSDGFEENYLKEISPSMATSVGLASRRLGDKQNKVS